MSTPGQPVPAEPGPVTLRQGLHALVTDLVAEAAQSYGATLADDVLPLAARKRVDLLLGTFGFPPALPQKPHAPGLTRTAEGSSAS